MNTIERLLATVVLGAASSAPVSAETAVFAGLGDLPGGVVMSYVEDMSADGTTVVGLSSSHPGPYPMTWPDRGWEAFRWTRETGIVGLGGLPDFPVSWADGVSADGRVIVGGVFSSPDVSIRHKPFVWTPETGMIYPGQPRGVSESSLIDISDDGLVALGRASAYNPSRASRSFRWLRERGFESLPGFVGEANGLSANGEIIVGWCEDSAAACRWTAGTGAIPLGIVAPYTESYASEVSADGTTIVGSLWRYPSDEAPAPSDEAFLWTEAGGFQLLGDLPGGDHASHATDVSADGRIVVGFGTTGEAETDDEAVVWDARHGMRSLQDVLEGEFDLDLQGWWLYRAVAISNDGTVVAGQAINPDGNEEGFIVTLPRSLDVVAVPIDIEPHLASNPIRFFEQTLVSVALLGSDAMKVPRADTATLAFGPAGAAPVRPPRRMDVNRDGRLDLVAFFRLSETGIAFGDTQACLRVQDRTGEPYEGCDAISTVEGCGRGHGVALLVLPLAWLRRRLVA